MISDDYSDALITEEEELRAKYGKVSELAAKKCVSQLDAHTRKFIKLSPFLCISSSRSTGPADISPRGDAPGFVVAIDDKHIVIPDRTGNNRLDTASNILSNPHIGLIFMVPGLNETLRINGRAFICAAAELLTRFEVRGKVPKTGILVEIDEVMFQCTKALVRSHLWCEDYKVERDVMPPLGQILKDQIKTDMTAEEAEKAIQESINKRLY